jgi:hypothetical protein
MDKNRLTPGNATILVAGVIMLIGSFLAFYRVSRAEAVLIFGGNESWNSWSTTKEQLLFPISTLVVLFGVAMAAHVALTVFATVDLPERPLGLSWDQVHIALGFNATVLMFAYLLRSKSVLEWGFGFWLMFISAIALLVGAVVRRAQANAPPRLQ